MKKLFSGIAVMALFACSAIAQEKENIASKELVTQEREHVLRRELAHLAAPIKTESDLREYLNSSSVNTGPLKRLSEAGRDRFLSSLTFNEKGVSSFRYEDLQAELTVSQIYQVLALFGAQDVTSKMSEAKASSSLDRSIMGGGGMVSPMIDHKDYSCTARATCTRAVGSICMSSC